MAIHSTLILRFNSDDFYASLVVVHVFWRSEWFRVASWVVAAAAAEIEPLFASFIRADSVIAREMRAAASKK
jgi:hypothetical protein